MYKCVHVFINTLLNACFKHRLLGQYHDSESVGFIRFVLVYTAIVRNLYLGVFYTTFHERLGNIVGTSLAEYIFRSIPVQHSGSAVSSQKCKNRLFLMSVRP